MAARISSRLSLRHGKLALHGLLLCTVLSLLVIYRLSSSSNELLQVNGNNLMKKIYSQDVARGEQIIAAMSGKVHNPAWKKLLRSKNMHESLAAALGSESSLATEEGKSFAADLGKILGVFDTSKQHPSPAAAHTPTSSSSSHARAGSHQSLSASSATKTTGVPHTTIASSLHHQRLRKPTSNFQIVYDSFAPGVIFGKVQKLSPKTIPNAVQLGKRGIKVTQLSGKINLGSAVTDHMTGKERLAAIGSGMLKATGFEDNYAVNHDPVSQLKGKVDVLQASLRQAEAKLKEKQHDLDEAKQMANVQAHSQAKEREVEVQPTGRISAGQQMSAVHHSSAPRKGAASKDHAIGEATAETPAVSIKRPEEKSSIAHATDKAPAEIVFRGTDTEDILNGILQQSHDMIQKGKQEEAEQQKVADHRKVSPQPPHAAQVVGGKVGAAHAAPVPKQFVISQHSAKVPLAAYKNKLLKCKVGEAGLDCVTNPAPKPPPVVLKRKSSSLLCALPLLAESSGYDCDEADKKVVLGRDDSVDDLYHILQAGLGDSKLPAKSIGGKTRYTPLELVKQYRELQASKAFGFSSVGQYERHKLVTKLEKAEDEIRGYKQKEAAEHGDIKIHTRGVSSSPRRGGAVMRQRGGGGGAAVEGEEAPWMMMRGPQGERRRSTMAEELGRAASGDIANAADRLVPVASLNR